MADQEKGEVLPEVPDAAIEENGTDGERPFDGAQGMADGGAEGAAVGDGQEHAGQIEGGAEGEESGEPLKLPANAQAAVNARIGKITARAKGAEEKLGAVTAERDELKQRVDRATDAVVLKAAEQIGVMPELLDKSAAGTISDYRNAKTQSEALEGWLEEHLDGDATMSLDVGGTVREFSRAEVSALRRQWRAKLEALGDEAPALIREARQKTRDIFTLGLAAQKAGWKPFDKAQGGPFDKAQGGPGTATPQAIRQGSGQAARNAVPLVRASVGGGSAAPRRAVAGTDGEGAAPKKIGSVNDLAEAIASGRLK